MTEVKISAKTAGIETFDLRYEGYRIRNKLQEKEVLESVRLNGILEPLEVINLNEKLVLVNGFKRYRSGKMLNLSSLPWISIGTNETEGVVNLIRQSNSKRLNILEEAKFLLSLTKEKKMNYTAVSTVLDKSVSWVSMRIQLLKDINAEIEGILFSGKFPVYAYMYILRPFIRMKGVTKEEIRTLVKLLSGKDLSVRQIEYLSEAWFRGSEQMKKQMQEGNLTWVLKRITEIGRQDSSGCSEAECRLLRDMERILEHMKQFPILSENKKLKSNAYRCQAHYLSNAIVSKNGIYIERMKKYNVDLGQKAVNLSAA